MPRRGGELGDGELLDGERALRRTTEAGPRGPSSGARRRAAWTSGVGGDRAVRRRAVGAVPVGPVRHRLQLACRGLISPPALGDQETSTSPPHPDRGRPRTRSSTRSSTHPWSKARGEAVVVDIPENLREVTDSFGSATVLFPQAWLIVSRGSTTLGRRFDELQPPGGPQPQGGPMALSAEGGAAYVPEMVTLIVVRIAALLCVAVITISLVIGLGSPDTGAIEKGALVAMIAGCVALAAWITTHATQAAVRIRTIPLTCQVLPVATGRAPTSPATTTRESRMSDAQPDPDRGRGARRAARRSSATTSTSTSPTCPTGPEVRCVSTVTLHLPRARRADASSTAPPRWCRPRSTASRSAAGRGGPDRARPTSPSDNVLVVETVQRGHPDGRGRAQGRRPGRRRGLRLDVVRAGRGAVRLGLLRPARPQGAARVHGHRAGRVDAWSATAATRSSRTPADARTLAFPDTPPLSTYNPVVNAGPFHEIRARGGGYDLGLLRPPLARRRSLERDAEELFTLTAQGLGVLRRASSRCRSRSASTTRSSCPSSAGRWRTTAASPGPTSSCAGTTPTPASGEQLRQGAAARDGAHVVRQHRHDALVGRPVAQRGVRRVRLPLGGGAGDAYTDAWAGACSPPTSSRAYLADQGPTSHPIRQPIARRRGGRVDLRRHHLPQGRGGAASSSMPTSARSTSSPAWRRYFARARLGQHHPPGPDRRARRGQRPGPRRGGGAAGWRPPAPTG